MTKTTKKPRKNVKLIRILKSLLYVGYIGGMIFLWPVKRLNSNMSDYEYVIPYKYLAEDSDNIIIFIVSLILISSITISIKFIKQHK